MKIIKKIYDLIKKLKTIKINIMLTRSMRQERFHLLDKFRVLNFERHFFDNESSEISVSRMVAKLDKQFKSRMNKEKKLLPNLRILRYGEFRKIIELRFGKYG